MTETLTGKPDKDPEECQHPKPIPSNGSWVCPECGEVLDPIYSRDPPPDFHMGTPESTVHHEVIPNHAAGNRTVFRPTADDKPIYRHLYKRAKQFAGVSERAVRAANQNLRNIVQQLHLNISKKMREEVLAKFYTTYKKGIGKRSTLKYRIAAILYIVIRQRKIPYSLKELASSLNLKRMRIRQYSNDICEKLNITIPPITLNDVTERLLGLLDADAETSVKVFRCINEFDVGKDFSGIDPKGLAGAVVYLVAERLRKYGITQKRIAEVTKGDIGVEWVSEITLRNNIKRLHKKGYMKDYIIHHKTRYEQK